MASARELFEAGRLDEAIDALNAGLRSRPDDVQARTFLFELLCFVGNWDRADKQLDILASADNPDKRLGALQYRGAINAERTRHEMLEKPPADREPLTPVAGTLNGKPFLSLEDADPRIGARLEVFAGDSYVWLPFEYLAAVECEAPKKLRDLLWIPATVQTVPGFKNADLGQVLIPVLSPFSSKHADGQVRLGRTTVWEEKDGEDVPFGQKMLLVDDEEIPFLEIRSLTIQHPNLEQSDLEQTNLDQPNLDQPSDE